MGIEKPLKDLQSLQWRKRVLLVWVDEARVEDVEQTLIDAAEAIEDRDLAWFIFSSDSLRTNYTGPIGRGFAASVANFKDPSDPLHLVLIGKDRGVKAQAAAFDLRSLFALIDTMPMRREEMRRKQ